MLTLKHEYIRLDSKVNLAGKDKAELNYGEMLNSLKLVDGLEQPSIDRCLLIFDQIKVHTNYLQFQLVQFS